MSTIQQSVQQIQNTIVKNNDQLKFNGISVKATEVGRYKEEIPLDVAKAALQNNGLDEILFEAQGKTYLAYADGMDFKGLKSGGVPSSVFKGNLPFVVKGEFQGKRTDIKLLHIDNESNTGMEGARNLLPVAVMQGGSLGLKIAMAPAAAKAAEHGTNLFAKISRFTGSMVTQASTKVGMNPIALGVTVGALAIGAGVAGGAVYFGHIKGEDYAAVKGLIQD